MKLAEKSAEVLSYVKENGGKVSIPELAEALGRNARSISGSVTALTKKGLAVREKIDGEDDAKITYVVLTDDGKAFVPTEEE